MSNYIQLLNVEEITYPYLYPDPTLAKITW